MIKKKTFIMVKYKIKTPKKKSVRRKLPGYCCSQCQDYYKSLNLSPKELEKRLAAVSRHRIDPGPSTPEYFWELDFPDTEECLRRGYIEEAKPVVLKAKTKYDIY